MVICLLIATMAATPPAHANKELHNKYTQILAGNFLGFFYQLTERWYHWNANKQKSYTGGNMLSGQIYLEGELRSLNLRSACDGILQLQSCLHAESRAVPSYFYSYS